MYWNPELICQGSRSGGMIEAGAGAAGAASGLELSNAAEKSCADAVNEKQSNAEHRIRNLRIADDPPRIPSCEFNSEDHLRLARQRVSTLIRRRVSRKSLLTAS